MLSRLVLRLLFLSLLPLVSLAAQTANAEPDPLVAYVTPSAVHRQLERFTGAWDAELRLTSPGSASTQTFTLKAESEMILGGRFLRTRLFGLMQGMLFEEISTLGFDNATLRFTRNALHTFGTGSLVTTGTWLEPDRVIELHGESVNPANRAAIRVRQRLTFESPDRILFESFETPAGAAESKTLEQHFTRR